MVGIAAQIEQAERHARHAVVHDVVDRTGRLVVAFRGIEDEPVPAVVLPFSGYGEPDLERSVALAVAVDSIRETPGAVVEGFSQLGANQFPGPGKELRQRIGKHVMPETIDDLRHPPDAQFDAGHQCAHVAHALFGEPGIAMKDLQRRLVGLPGVDQLGDGNDDTFLEYLGGIRADRSRVKAADVGKVGPTHDEGAALAIAEHRRKQHLVVGVGHRAIASRNSHCTSRDRRASWYQPGTSPAPAWSGRRRSGSSNPPP